MSVEIKSMSRFKAFLIAMVVLFIGLAIIFGVKYLMMQSGKTDVHTIESQK